jgi:condensin complex subunit 1
MRYIFSFIEKVRSLKYCCWFPSHIYS